MASPLTRQKPTTPEADALCIHTNEPGLLQYGIRTDQGNCLVAESGLLGASSVRFSSDLQSDVFSTTTSYPCRAVRQVGHGWASFMWFWVIFNLNWMKKNQYSRHQNAKETLVFGWSTKLVRHLVFVADSPHNAICGFRKDPCSVLPILR